MEGEAFSFIGIGIAAWLGGCVTYMLIRTGI